MRPRVSVTVIPQDTDELTVDIIGKISTVLVVYPISNTPNAIWSLHHVLGDCTLVGKHGRRQNLTIQQEQAPPSLRSKSNIICTFDAKRIRSKSVISGRTA